MTFLRPKKSRLELLVEKKAAELQEVAEREEERALHEQSKEPAIRRFVDGMIELRRENNFTQLFVDTIGARR